MLACRLYRLIDRSKVMSADTGAASMSMVAGMESYGQRSAKKKKSCLLREGKHTGSEHETLRY